MRRLRRIAVGYLALCGLLLHIALLAYPAWHFLRSGLSAADYFSGLSRRIKVDYPSLEPLAHGIDRLLFDSGLLVTTAHRYPRDLQIELPPWQGQGASTLRRDTRPRYDRAGRPVAVGDGAHWDLAAQPQTRPVLVASVPQLQRAVDAARPGDEIVLAAGHYQLDRPLRLSRPASAARPILLRGSGIGEVSVAWRGAAAFELSAPYWAVTDLVLQGECANHDCPAAVRLTVAAAAATLRNLFVSGTGRLVAAADTAPATAALIDGVTLLGGTVGAPADAVRIAALRQLPIPAGERRFVRVCADNVGMRLCDSTDLSRAVSEIADGGVLLLRQGSYRQGVQTGRQRLHIIAEPGAHLVGAAVAGKGAIVANGDLIVEGLTCSAVSVPSGNGACVRQQRGDLHLIGVHFYRSQMGVLTGHNGGRIRIEDSYIHDSGWSGRGNLGHNVYVNSGELEFVRSWSVAAHRAGHEIKSRGRRTLISRAVVASANAVDSRLIDVPRGGELIVEDSLLLEGPRSENWELVGFGLEKRDQPVRYPHNRVILTGNTIYFDRPRGAELLNAERAEEIRIVGNVMIGARRRWPGNEQFDSREDAGVASYPYMKKL